MVDMKAPFYSQLTHAAAVVSGAIGMWLVGYHPGTPQTGLAGGSDRDQHPPAAELVARAGERDEVRETFPDAAEALVADAGVVAMACPDRPVRVERTMTALHGFLDRSDDDPASETTPELAANALAPYVDGWADALLNSDPEAVSVIAEHLTSELCSGGHGRASTVMLLRVAGRIAIRAPELRAGVRCILRSEAAEDIVLWTALDVWRSADYVDGADLDAIRARATDPRTVQRLMSREQQALARTASHIETSQ